MPLPSSLRWSPVLLALAFTACTTPAPSAPPSPLGLSFTPPFDALNDMSEQRYQQCLLVYLQQINQSPPYLPFSETEDDRLAQDPDVLQARATRAALTAKMAAHPDAVVADLAAKAKTLRNGKLDDEYLEHLIPCLIADSPASADIIERLHQIGAIQDLRSPIMSILYQQDPAPAWIDLTTRTMAAHPDDATFQLRAAIHLQLHGIVRDRDTARLLAFLQQLPKPGGTAWSDTQDAFNAVFYTHGKIAPLPRINPNTLTLYRQLATRQNSPMVHADAAAFAAAIHDTDTARQTCDEILATDFVWFTHPDGPLPATESIADGELIPAHVSAVRTLFFAIKGESSFRRVWDHLRHTSTGLIGPQHVTAIACPSCRLELQQLEWLAHWHMPEAPLPPGLPLPLQSPP